MMPSLVAARMKAVAGGDQAQLARIRELEAQVADLEAALGMNAAAHYPCRLAPMQRAMLGILLTRQTVSKSQFLFAMYAGRADADRPGDPDTNLKVQLCYLRRRIRPDGIEIETILGARSDYADSLWRIAPAGRAIALALMSAKEQAA